MKCDKLFGNCIAVPPKQDAAERRVVVDRPPNFPNKWGTLKRKCKLSLKEPIWGWGVAILRRLLPCSPVKLFSTLASGAGSDCFLAARQVGESGRVIGVDMTPEMLAKARNNATIS